MGSWSQAIGDFWSCRDRRFRSHHRGGLYLCMEKEGAGIEIDKRTGLYIYPDKELDKDEGAKIEALKAVSQKPIPDSATWLDEKLSRNIIVTSLDIMLDWARRASLWPVLCFPACCAFELITAAASRFDISRFGMEIIRASPRQADLMITAGTLTWKMAPNVRRIYDQMAEPKWVIAMGACAC